MRVIHIVVVVEKASQGAWLFDFLRVHLISLSLSPSHSQMSPGLLRNAWLLIAGVFTQTFFSLNVLHSFFFSLCDVFPDSCNIMTLGGEPWLAKTKINSPPTASLAADFWRGSRE